MKLGITTEQFDELSDDAKERYKDWCISHGLEVKETGVEEGDKVEYDVPLWEIGELIAYLYEHGVLMESALNSNINDVTLWCDKLWQACKPILEQPTETV